MLDGIVVIDKPAGPSSADVVARVRHELERGLRSVAPSAAVTPARGQKRRGVHVKAGHAGTLDPFASGVLVVCLGESTKLAQFLLGEDKTYRATVRFGAATDTMDHTGRVIAQAAPAALAGLTAEAIDAELAKWRGAILQTPPMFSAIKQGGRPLYELARQGIEVERNARKVTLHRLERVSSSLAGAEPEVELDVECSSGTYIRSLAHDIGSGLGVFAHLRELRRTRVGGFDLADAVAFESLEGHAAQGTLPVLGWSRALSTLPCVRLSAELAYRVRCGQPLVVADLAGAGPESLQGGGRVRLEDSTGDLVAVVRLPNPAVGRVAIERAFNVPTAPRTPVPPGSP